MMVLQKVKNNLFLAATVLAYGIVLVISPSMAADSVGNSWYYIREMLQIMPVVFLLTALLDAWIPKEFIMRFLGNEAGVKGTILSFVLGSVSAGPIYTAFPISIMLLKKGASIRNIVIILSAWAVVKIPMLIAETKFLGIEFMAIRWVLTVIAILIFSWITSRIVGPKDIPQEALAVVGGGVSVMEESCMGCGICARIYPELFSLDNKKAQVASVDDIDMVKVKEAAEACPAKTIRVVE